MGKQKATVADGGGKLPAKKPKLPGKENLEAIKKPKKIKNVDELQQNGKGKDAKVPAKKRKVEVKEEEAVDTKEKPTELSSINKNIFAVFNKLKDTKQEHIIKHLKEMLTLLTTEANENKGPATSAYAVKRLVRCTGADDMEAVALSGSYLCAMVDKVPDMDPITLLDTLKRELPVGSQQKGKEESLAAVGQLITVLAIIKSQHFKKPTKELIAAVYSILVAHLKGREYVMTMCADIMADSFKQVNAASFESHVWPLLQQELNKPLTALKLHGCDLLLAVHFNYPKLLPLKKLESSLWRKQAEYKQLFDLYMSSQSIQGNGIYARLGHFLATSNGGQLLNEWQQHIVEQLPLKHNTAKSYVIQTLSFILLHFDDSKNSSQLEQLFKSEPLMSLLLQELSLAKQLTEEQAKPGQLQLRQICRQFEACLLLSFKRQLKQDSSKLAILQQLLQLQLQLDSIVQTPRLNQQLLSCLGEFGVQAMYKFYSEQFTSNKQELSKMHREHCLKYMQLLLLNPQLKDRKQQLQFLLPVSIFHLNEQQEACNAAEAAAFSRQGASRCEEILFGCLLHKIGNSNEQLESLVAQLRDTLQQLSKLLAQPNIESKLRSKHTPESQHTWQKVLEVLNANPKDTKDTKKSLTLVFDALILFLGLAIYAPSCNVPIDLLNDLFICKQNALKKTNNKAEAELGWQDVLTDVLLQLFLQTGHFWREFVNKIGGALMPQLGKENLEQLLVMLDMTKNPLGDKEQGEEEESDEEEDVDEEETSDEEEDEDEDDEEEDEADNDDEATNLELIRENVRKALLGEDNEDNDNDASSVDWNDVDEEQGERLNMALERAFQAYKPKGNKGNKAQTKHQTKAERIQSTSLLHFRVRVLDLVEIFIQAQPQLEMVLDALTTVYYVYQVSIQDTKSQPLAEASKKLLRKLLTQKISYKTPAEDKQPILDCIQQFITQEEPSSTDPQKPQQPQQQSIKKKGDLAEWRNKCVAYLVSQFNEQDVTTSAVWPLLEDYLQDWITRRSSPHTLASFDAIFVSQWNGIPQLALKFVSLLSKDLRNFRRNQILDLLAKHIGRIRIAFASANNNNNNNKSAAKVFVQLLTKYEPVGPKDRNQHSKLLNQLKKFNN